MYNFMLVTSIVLISAISRHKASAIYYGKLFAFYFLIMVLSVIPVPFLIFRPGDPDVIRFFNAVGRLLIYPFLGLKYELYGMEHLSAKEARLIVGNHQHEIDMICNMYIQPYQGKSLTVAKKEILYKTGFFGLYSYLSGCIYVSRTNSNRDREMLNEIPGILKKKQMKLFVYPEGTRRNTGEIHQFKKGAFHVAVQGQLPIVPVVFSRYYFLDPQKRRFDTGHIIISALPPVPTEGLTAKDVDELALRVHRIMEQEFNRINQIAVPQQFHEKIKTQEN